MEAAVLSAVGELGVRELKRPNPETDEVLVRVDACGVCTTDYHLYEGGLSVEKPIVPGHESAGEVVEVGESISEVSVGDRVAINPSVPCDECRHCVAGRENLCRDLTSLGGAAINVEDGSFAEYVAVPAGNVEPIGDLSASQAAFAEPLGCCVHGIDQVGVESGETAAVVGAGPIGLLLVGLLHLRGASPIVVSEPIAERRERALAIGADHVIDPTETDPVAWLTDTVGPADLSVEVVGTTATIEQARDLTGVGGRTLVFGVPPEDAALEVSPFEIFTEERELLGSYSLTPHSFRRAVTLLRNERIDVDSLVTHEVDLAGIPDAFDRMGASEGLKQMVYPQR